MPNLLDGLFATCPFCTNPWVTDLFTLMYTILSWDIVKGGLVFMLGVGIALYAVLRIRQAFGG